MKRLAFVAVLMLAGVVGIGIAAPVAAQDKAEKTQEAAAARWSGSIVRLNDKTSTVTVRKGHIEKIVHFDASTRWTKGKATAERSQFTAGSRVICMGKYDDKKEFVADRIDLREPHMVPMP